MFHVRFRIDSFKNSSCYDAKYCTCIGICTIHICNTLVTYSDLAEEVNFDALKVFFRSIFLSKRFWALRTCVSLVSLKSNAKPAAFGKRDEESLVGRFTRLVNIELRPTRK